MIGVPFEYSEIGWNGAPTMIAREAPELLQQLCCSADAVLWHYPDDSCHLPEMPDRMVVCGDAPNNGVCGSGESLCNSTSDCYDTANPPSSIPCVEEGEYFWSDEVEEQPCELICCEGLVESHLMYPVFDDHGTETCFYGYEIVCTPTCGDDICSISENECICPQDCE